MLGISTGKTFPRTLLWIEWFVERIVKWEYVVQVDGMDFNFLIFVRSTKLEKQKQRNCVMNLAIDLLAALTSAPTNLFLKT